MLYQAKLILKKCSGLPLAISTIGGYLANKPITAMEWRKLNDSLSAELEINPDLKMINTALMRSFGGLPYHLKACFLYLSIFPEDHKIRRKRVVRRWIAEGYLREMQQLAAEQVGDKHFDELVDRSMILPLEVGSPGKIDYCELHDLIREICVSKAREENLVFTLEEGCSLGGAQGAIRHLSISGNWKRDKDVMQRRLDVSHLRSLTVFGKWRPFFISNKMRFLRVLDLEHTTGLRDHHLDQIMELLHLRYLSLRGCGDIFGLPDSLANLGQLQTLDVRGTRIWKLPAAVAKLQKLQYLHASGSSKGEHIVDSDILEAWEAWYMWNVWHTQRQIVDNDALHVAREPYRYSTLCCQPVPAICRRCFPRTAAWLLMGHLLCRPQLLEVRSERSGGHVLEDGVSRQDLCNLYRYVLEQDKMPGVRVPRGISRLRALHTLRVVNVAGGKAAIFEELRELTQLRKLGVVGVHDTNMEMFWRSIAGHNRLQSLSVGSAYVVSDPDSLDDCLSENLCPPRYLESLKMRCKLVKVTKWIHRLQNLSKLQVENTRLGPDALEAIGMLPNLAVLRLKYDSVDVEKVYFRGSSYPSLLVLELDSGLDSVIFEKGTMPKLEVLQASSWYSFEKISGLQSLTSLKEIRLDDELKEVVQRELAEHPINVVLKIL